MAGIFREALGGPFRGVYGLRGVRPGSDPSQTRVRLVPELSLTRV
jgi:hypothetical protein